MHVCMCCSIAKWLEYQPGNRKVPRLCQFGVVFVSVSNGEAAHNINGYLVFTGTANAQLSLSRLVVLGLLWNFGFRDLSPFYRTVLLVLAQENFPAQASSA